MQQMVKANICTYVSEYYGSQVFPGQAQEVVFIGRFQGQGDVYRSLLHFDLELLAKYEKLIEQGHPVYLRLCLARNTISNGTLRVGIHRIFSLWDPAGTAWNNQPGHSFYPDTSFIIPGKWKELILVNINGLVNGWLKGYFPNYGFIIKGNENTDSLVAFRSSEYPGLRAAPVLLFFA
mgnify:CR=1 FL=1